MTVISFKPYHFRDEFSFRDIMTDRKYILHPSLWEFFKDIIKP